MWLKSPNFAVFANWRYFSSSKVLFICPKVPFNFIIIHLLFYKLCVSNSFFYCFSLGLWPLLCFQTFNFYLKWWRIHEISISFWTRKQRRISVNLCFVYYCILFTMAQNDASCSLDEQSLFNSCVMYIYLLSFDSPFSM